MTIRIKINLLLFLVILVSACGSKTPVPPAATPAVDTASTAVAAALTAIPPQPTYTPYPTATPYPTPDLSGLFCEYEFCIGHPVGISFFDLEVVNDYTTNRSSYDQGMLIGFNENMYIFVSWSRLAGEFDPSVMITSVLQSDMPQATLLTEGLGGRSISYILLQSTASSILPFGLAAAWRCGDRQFGWKIYTAQDGQANDFLRAAVDRFKCTGG